MKKISKLKLDIGFVISECTIDDEEIDITEIKGLSVIFSRANVDISKLSKFIKWDLNSDCIEYVSHKVLSANISGSVSDAVNAIIIFELKTEVDFDLDSEEEADDFFSDLRNGFVIEIENESFNITFYSNDVQVSEA